MNLPLFQTGKRVLCRWFGLILPFGPFFQVGRESPFLHRRGSRPDGILVLVEPLHDDGLGPKIGPHAGCPEEQISPPACGVVPSGYRSPARLSGWLPVHGFGSLNHIPEDCDTHVGPERMAGLRWIAEDFLVPVGVIGDAGRIFRSYSWAG